MALDDLLVPPCTQAFNNNLLIITILFYPCPSTEYYTGIEETQKSWTVYLSKDYYIPNDYCKLVTMQYQACASLKAVAVKLRVNSQLVNEAVTNAVKKSIQNTQDIILFVRDTLVKKATNFQCTDVLTAEQCDKIALVGKNLKLSTLEVAEAVRQAVAAPIEKASVIFVAALFYLNDLKKNVKCETLVSEEVCKKVVDYATSLKLSTEDAANAIKEAILQGANDAADYYNKATEYLRAQISCENVLSTETCEKVRKIADKFSVSLTEINSALRSAVASGVTKVTDLYKHAVKFIVEKWTQSFGDEPMMNKRSIEKEVSEKIVCAVEMFVDATTTDF